MKIKVVDICTGEVVTPQQVAKAFNTEIHPENDYFAVSQDDDVTIMDKNGRIYFVESKFKVEKEKPQTTLSMLIKELTRRKRDHGDVPVVLMDLTNNPDMETIPITGLIQNWNNEDGKRTVIYGKKEKDAD